MTTRGEKTPATPLLVLQKISDILDAFSGSASELTLSEVRAQAGLPASTTQRLVSNLVSLGFLDQSDGKYRIGMRMLHWATPVARARDIPTQARSVVEGLRDEFGETACLFRREGLMRVCIVMAETRHTLRSAMWVGQITPLPAGSAGRVLTAWDEQAQRELLSGPLEPLTRGTVLDPATVRELLAQTRADGWAITSGERESEATGVSVPVRDEHGDVTFALTIQGPAERVTEERCRSWLPRLVESAQTLSGPH